MTTDRTATETLARRLLPWGYGAAFTACALNAVWLACIITLESLGDAALQAREHPGLFRLSVGAALLLTLAQVPLLLATAAQAARRDPARALVGGAFYLLYVPVNLIGYFSYGRLAPLVHGPQAGVEGAQVVAGLVEIGHPLGLTGNLPLLGYALLGLAWCLLASALWGRAGLWRVAAALLFTSGVLSVLGGLGAFIDLQWLATCCFYGGVVSFPALALLGAALWREAKRGVLTRATASQPDVGSIGGES